jgi:hypothetical protein
LCWHGNDVGGGAGVVTGFCIGDGVCASLCGVQIEFPSWFVQVGLCKSRLQVRVLWISWLPFFEGVSLPKKSR